MGEIVTSKQFWEYKVDWFIKMWHIGRHNDDNFLQNMLLMGWDEDTIKDCLDDYYEEE